MRSFLSWLHGRNQFPFPNPKFRVPLAIWFDFRKITLQFFPKKPCLKYRSLTGLITAIRGLKHLLSSLFASTFASRAVSSTDNKFQQSDNLDLKTLPFLTIKLAPSPQGTGYKCSCLKRIWDPALLHPPQAPPARNFLLLSAPLLACRMVEGGGTSSLWCSCWCSCC